MQWNDSFSESVHTFANTINTHEGGTHEEGFRAALTTTVNKLRRGQQSLIKKKEDRLTGDDIREGLTAIISIKLEEPQFEGQTKTKLGNTEAKVVRPAGAQRRARCVVRAATPPRARRSSASRSTPRRRAWPPARRATWPATARASLGGGGLPGKLDRLPVAQPRGVRDLHRRGQLGRWLRQGRPRPAYPGDPPAARQDPQRREGAHRQDPAEHRGPGDHLARSAPASTRTSTSPSCAITRSC